MKIQMKRPITIIVVGLIGLGFLLFTQAPKQKGSGNKEEIFVTTQSTDKQQRQKRLSGSKKVSPRKSHVSNNHSKFNLNSTEAFDEMEIFDESSTGIHLRTHFNLLEDTELGAQEKLEESLEKMRETPEVFVTKLTEVYDELDRDNFLAKYKILFIMENLRSSYAVPFLNELANSDFPDDISLYKGDGHVNEPHNEGLIRMRAVGGLSSLANEEGDTEARNSLLDVAINAKDRTVKNDAIRAYLSSSKDLEADKEYLKGVLSDNDQQFITLKLTNIEDVQEQIESVNENKPLL